MRAHARTTLLLILSAIAPGCPEARLTQLFAGSLNESTTLANFLCRSIRSAKILACILGSLPTELVVTHEVALTVIGMPFTVFVIAIGPVVCWAVAPGTKPATSNALRKSAFMPRLP